MQRGEPLQKPPWLGPVQASLPATLALRGFGETRCARLYQHVQARLLQHSLIWFSRLSTGKTAKSLPSTIPNCRCCCRNSRTTSRVTADSPRLQTPPNGSRSSIRTAARVSAKRTPCRSGQVPAGTTSAISTLAMAMHLWQRNSKSTGCRLTSMWAVPNTPCSTCSTAASGTKVCKANAAKNARIFYG